MQPDRKTRKQIKKLLLPFVQGSAQQNAMLTAVFFDHPARNQINVGTPPDPFAEEVIRRAAGETIDGEPGIYVLLEELHDRVGKTKQQEIEAIRAGLRLGGSARPSDAGRSSTGSGSQTFNIGGNITGENVNIGGTQHISGNHDAADDD